MVEVWVVEKVVPGLLAKVRVHVVEFLRGMPTSSEALPCLQVNATEVV